MSSVCVLTPVVVASWPIVSSAVLSAAAAMGFTVVSAGATVGTEEDAANRVEVDVENSDVVAEHMAARQSIRIVRQGVEVEISTNENGVLTVCASGKGSKAQLRVVGEEVAGRVVQQFAYHKLMSELSARGFRIEQESVGADQAIEVRVTAR